MRIIKLTQFIELLATKNRLAYCITSAYYRFLVKREAVLANINEKDRVLCIGGGICPYTAILLHRYTRAHVTVEDSNKRCVEEARKFISRKGYKNINVVLGKGEDLSYDGYTVIHLAMQITPKELVLREVLSRAQEGTRVLIRKPKKGVERLYCRAAEEEKHFARCIKHSLFSNVDYTSVCIVDREAVGSTI